MLCDLLRRLGIESGIKIQFTYSRFQKNTFFQDQTFKIANLFIYCLYTQTADATIKSHNTMHILILARVKEGPVRSGPSIWLVQSNQNPSVSKRICVQCIVNFTSFTSCHCIYYLQNDVEAKSKMSNQKRRSHDVNQHYPLVAP